MITLKKLAELANVSVSTVSRALNDGFDVSPETRNRVLQLARESGYFLEKKRVKTENRQKNHFQIAILCPEINSEFYSVVAAKLISALHKENCNCILYHSGFDPSLMSELFINCVDSSDIDAIIALGNIPSLPIPPSIPLISTNSEHPHASHIYYDIQNIFIAITNAAKEKGISKIAFVNEPLTKSKGELFKNHADSCGFCVEQFCADGRFDTAGQEAAEYFLNQKHLPELFICAYDEIACGLIDTLQNGGVKVPDDVKVIGWNDTFAAHYCFGGLTTVRYEIDKVISRICADLLQDRKDKTFSPKTYHVSSSFIRRNTF